jgi:hypothetical protein
MRPRLAHYKCLKCGFEYHELPHVTACWQCGHLCVEWLNYKEMFGDRILEDEE